MDIAPCWPPEMSRPSNSVIFLREFFNKIQALKPVFNDLFLYAESLVQKMGLSIILAYAPSPFMVRRLAPRFASTLEVTPHPNTINPPTTCRRVRSFNVIRL